MSIAFEMKVGIGVEARGEARALIVEVTCHVEAPVGRGEGVVTAPVRAAAKRAENSSLDL